MKASILMVLTLANLFSLPGNAAAGSKADVQISKVSASGEELCLNVSNSNLVWDVCDGSQLWLGEKNSLNNHYPTSLTMVNENADAHFALGLVEGDFSLIHLPSLKKSVKVFTGNIADEQTVYRKKFLIEESKRNFFCMNEYNELVPLVRNKYYAHTFNYVNRGDKCLVELQRPTFILTCSISQMCSTGNGFMGYTYYDFLPRCFAFKDEESCNTVADSQMVSEHQMSWSTEKKSAKCECSRYQPYYFY